MEVFKAREVKEDEIVLESAEDLAELYKVIQEEDQFILQWPEDGKMKSEVMIVTQFSAKVKNSQIKLSAIE